MKTVIYGVLKEEKSRNLEMQEMYEKELESLRKGSVGERKVANNTYYYLKYREGNKIITEYLGKDKEKAERVNYETARRKYIKSVLKRLKLEYKQICKIVKE